ncbi:hypothetical protein, partial [uncultured Paraglaciecola sp.]|uniref:hypothetical protein n=1 Tax=uncultured Paraglaciecola sp. TaxID=1765024 RepID=UPI002626D9BD
MARQCLADSESYLDASHRRQIEKNIANYQSRHPAGSKYHTQAYKARNKKFQPKTKAMGLRRDAAVSAAFFSTSDVTVVEAVNKDDKQQAAAAALYHKIMERRLGMNGSVKWFQTVIGASQDAFVQSVCVSCQYWDYKVDADGDVVKDTPAVRLIPIENFRYSPSADWRDPVNDSEYLIEIIPMTVAKVVDKMLTGEWANADASAIAASTR